ncbi:iron complex outermembrane receptor protein [Paucibacter oligotrophus]|uniref:Iron complex outermembrane receptor protein n=1 Tax=Roseateles oligotrophus TaxID=1769250 RepID=A0A840LEM0_9BURK|nr:TonB-dependent siderophore receptor [Roseateles oligotrophus]MBB4845103.1 iron complex outermembrane receptor protein [Roseateles oligotrophus]
MTKPTFSPRPQRLALAVHAAMMALPMTATGVAICAAPSAAHAQATAQAPAQAMHDFDIPAGPLSTALTRVAAQSGVPLTADAALTAGKTAPALKGRMTLREALAQLLAGSGLAAGAEGASIVIKAAPPAPGGAKEAVLPVVTVRAGAEQESSWGPVKGYVATHSAMATKTDTAIIETPQSISVIGRDELDARGVNATIEALRYVPGVVTSFYGQDDRSWEWFSIRGFGSSYDANYLDGLRQPSGGYTVLQNEPYGLERIEVLRGPSSTMYGQGDAGGVISRISKRPRADAPREVEVQLGNYGRRRLAADLGGVLDDDGKLIYRVVAAGLGTDPQNDYPGWDEKRSKRTYIAPSIAWKPSPDTTLVVLADYHAFRTTSNSNEYVGQDHKRTRILTGEPSHDLHDQRQWSLGYQFEHRLNPNWTIRQNLRTARADLDAKFVYGYGSADALGNFAQDAYKRDESLRYTALDNQLQGRFDWFGMQHTALVGVDWLRVNFDDKAYTGAGPTLNVNNPVYGQPVADPSTLYESYVDKQRQLGFYAQDQMKLGPSWRITAGLRHDRAHTDNNERLAATTPRRDDSATTGRLGVSYVMASGLAPYASYAESFLPQVGSDFSGKRFDPTRGKQLELGVKYQPGEGKALFTAAVFDLTKTNVQTLDPEHVGYNVQTGEVRSRGLELEIKQELFRGLNVSAQYTWTDTEVTKSGDADLGKQLPNVPRHLASAWMDYKVQGNDWRGLGFGLGVRHVGKRYDDSANSLTSSSYTLVDAALTYDAGNWSLALNVNNLFDKDYLANASYGYPGSRRTAVLSAKYRF